MPKQIVPYFDPATGPRTGPLTAPEALPVNFVPGGLKFKDAAAILAGVVDNGVCADDPRVMQRTNEATKIILDYMIPVGGMASYNVAAIDTVLYLPPQLENVIEAYPIEPNTQVYQQSDIAQGWYEIVNGSTFLDPNQHHDNPLVDYGLWPDKDDPSLLRRVMAYPGLQPTNAIINVTGAKRFVPIKEENDYLIVQNLEALKLVILSMERNENAAPDEAPKYRQQAFELLQAEIKKHILDPRNYMRRKASYQADLLRYPDNTVGNTRAQIALDVDQALLTGKEDLLWHILQAERRIMQRGFFKDTIQTITAEVVGGIVYFPINVAAVMAIDLSGRPIPIRSQFFQHLENGPGMFPCSEMLVDQGDEYLPGTQSLRRKYKLLADCDCKQQISAVIKLRWMPRKAQDMMVIKNYEAIRLMVTAKFLEEDGKWQEAIANQQQAFDILDKELRDFLGGIKHTIQIQTYGFGLGDVGNRYWHP